MALPKLKEKAAAIRKRKSGLSVKVIAKQLKVSTASVSIWVKHVVLSKQQQKELLQRSRGPGKALKASLVMQNNYRQRRKIAREQGRVLARAGSLDLALGCALYWAEGTKSRNSLGFANTDFRMVKKFYDFLTKTMAVDPACILIQAFCHGDKENAPVTKCRSFWSELLGVRLSKVEIVKNKDKRARTGHKKNRHYYGMAVLTVHDTLLLQKIYGAIEVFGGSCIQDF